jgi:DNA polymerase-3 subunit delta'
MTLPDPRANPDLLGHAAAEAALLDAARSGRLHHAWLLLGPPGIGKATLAFRFARRLLAGLPPTGDNLALPPDHPVFRRVAAGSHADLLTVECSFDEKRKKMRGEIVVDDVRRIPDFLRLTPAEGGWRIVVIDGAEDLNRNAANALLKALEEPPRQAMLLLVCNAIGSLPPTIRSRCRRLRLAPLAEADVAALAARALPDRPAAEHARLAALADGSIGHALDLALEDGVAVAELVARALVEPSRLSLGDALATADALGREEEAFSTFTDLTRAGVATTVRAAARGRADPAQARTVGNRGLAEWVGVWQALGALQHETEDLHLDRREALVQGFRLLARGTSAPAAG